MEREDYIKKMFDQMARVLGNALAKVMGLKESALTSQEVKNLKDNIKNELNIDIDELATISIENLIRSLEEKNITRSNMDIFSRLFAEIVLTEPAGEKHTDHLTKSKLLLEHVIFSDKTFSAERQHLLSKINSKLTGI